MKGRVNIIVVSVVGLILGMLGSLTVVVMVNNMVVITVREITESVYVHFLGTKGIP